LAERSTVDAVEIAWPSGKNETYRKLAADFIYTIVEGEGVRQKTPLSVQAATD